MKKLPVLLLIAALLLPFAAAGAQQENLRHLYDQTGTFSFDTQQRLEEEMDAIWRDLNVDVVIVTTDDSEGKSAELFAADFYEAHRSNYAAINDCVIFAFCFDIGERGAYGEATHGSARSALSALGDGALYEVLAPYLPSRSYGDAMFAYLRYVRQQLTPQTPLAIAQSYFPFVLIFAFVVALIVVFAMRGKMHLARNKSDAAEYTRRNSLNLTASQDIFLYETERRVRIESNKSSGGSSGGRGFSSSSGRSYGGRSGSL